MGTDDPRGYPADGQAPVHEVELSANRMGVHPVTNDQFAEFVEATGHRTTAEEFGTSFVFAGLLPHDFPPTRAVAATPWWREIEGADWNHPEGPRSNLEGRGDHPVVHVSWVRRRGILQLGGLPTAHRGRVGAGRARPPSRPSLRMG
jgi:sulfatase modifying factor 1